MKKIISLLTDFGLGDAYVAIMKGVILSIDSSIEIVDLCHTLPSFDIRSAAWQLFSAYKYFPKNTIFIAVVDPGVGTDRLKILVKTPDYYFIAPDNAILSYILAEETIEKVISITNNKYFLSQVSNTFHGRDIFAPVGAHLAKDFAIVDDLGEQISFDCLVKYNIGKPKYSESFIVAEIIHIDKFGNLITNIPSGFLEGKNFRFKLGEFIIESLSNSYSCEPSAELMLIIGSSGFIEISAYMNSAREIIKAFVGQKVFVDFCK